MEETFESPPPTTNAHTVASVTPASNSNGIDKRLTVEKGVVDELLLVCGVIGSTASDPSNNDQLIPVTDCLNWLQDLQRALRRDDDSYRPISLLVGKWKVVEQKLLPLVMSCRYDTPMVLTILKILVILTKPINENAKSAGRMAIDVKSRKVPEDVIQEQIKLRENAIAQSEMLMEYKRIIAHHPSHRKKRTGSNEDEEKEGGILSVFVSLLAEPLSKSGTDRSDSDHLTIELVLHLFRNLLSAEPILKSSWADSLESAILHQELIALYDRELVLDIVLVIAQEMELRENAPYNLLMMEILHLLLRNQDPMAVARLAQVKGSQNHCVARTSGVSRQRAPKAEGSLRSQLLREKQKAKAVALTRHSNFGGTLLASRSDGKRQYKSAVMTGKRSDRSTAVKKKNRKTSPFVGAGRALSAHSRGKVSNWDDGPAANRCRRALHNFCVRFVKECYGPVMKSLKNEFRRDSVRLEEGDRVIFFRIIWFFCQWWRVSGAEHHLKSADSASEGASDESNGTLGQIIFTMDVFTFNLVLNSTDHFAVHKKHAALAQTVALYSEMMHMLLTMYRSKDSTEKIMAFGLMNRLFYGSEPLDRLPRLLSKWTAGAFTREYLCDLVELCHVTMKLLELIGKESNEDSDAAGNLPDAEKKRRDTLSRMKEAASEFDVSAYISRRIVSNHVVFMYTHLLSQYAVNASHVNHYLVAFFTRLRKKAIFVEDSPDEDNVGSLRNPLASKTVTMEPMLYHVQLLLVLDKVLNDASIRGSNEHTTLLSFATSAIGRFAQAASKNPLLFAEALFRHPLPHRFCDLTTNMYVSEELRMIAEREMLLDETRIERKDANDSENESCEEGQRVGKSRLRDQESSPSDNRLSNDVSDDEEEQEWKDQSNDISGDTITAKAVRSAKRKRFTKTARDGNVKSRLAEKPVSDDEEESDEDSSELSDDKVQQEHTATDQEIDAPAKEDLSPPSPKRQRLQEDGSPQTEEPLPTTAKTSTRQRIRKVSGHHLDSSDEDDEEVFFDTPSQNVRATQKYFFDGED